LKAVSFIFHFLYETDYTFCVTTSRDGVRIPFCSYILLILRRILLSISCIWETDFDIRFAFF